MVVTTSSQSFQIMVKKNEKNMAYPWTDFQKERNLWNKERVKRLDFINKRLREQQDARQAINNAEDGMREYYRVFGRKIKPLPKEPVFSDFYHPSESQKKEEMTFVIL